MKTTAIKKDVYQMVTDAIIGQLENNIIPWKKTWKVNPGAEISNYVTKKAYRGINILLLGSLPYEHPFYMTFNQIRNLGGTVIKGEKSHIVVFWKYLYFDANDQKTDDPKMAVRTIPFLNHFNVFNVEQVKGIEFDFPEKSPINIDRINENCQAIINQFENKPKIELLPNYSAPAYFPSLDLIKMPLGQYFDSTPGYYSTLFHELVHSTGHFSRLKREGIINHDGFGSEQYSFEELVAEIGASFLCAQTGIIQDTVDNSVAYIKGWLRELKNDKKFIVSAATKAGQAVDYIKNLNIASEEVKEVA